MRRLLALALLFCALPLAAAPPRWVEVKSSHFTVLTDDGDKRGRDVALRFEQMRAVFASLIARDESLVNFSVPLQIVAFRNSKELRAYGPRWQGKPVEVSGFFQKSDDRDFIALDLSAENGWSTVFHEYAHILLNSNFPPCPLWFDEGFAEYYSTIAVEGKQVYIGRAPAYVAPLLRENRLSTLEMLKVTHDDKTYNETGDRRHVFYAQSWLMVHYLFDMKKLTALASYLELVDQGAPIPEAFQRSFGMDPKTFDKELDNFFHSSKGLMYHIPVPAALKNLEFTARVLDDADAQAALADLHLHSRDYSEQAIGEFEAVLKLNPDHAGAHTGLAYAYMRKGDMGRAAAEFRLAVANDSKDARVHYLHALLMQRSGGTGAGDRGEMRKELETAVALDPNLADAHNLLGWAYSAEGNYEAAIRSTERAIQLSPRNEHYQMNLCHVYMTNRDWDKADAILSRLKNSSDPLIAHQAESDSSMLAQLRQAQTFRSTRPEPDGGTIAIREEVTVTPTKTAPPAEVAIKYMKGILVSSDCSATPAALLIVTSGGQNWNLRAPDSKKLIVIGADEFSCSWRNRKISVNFRPTGDHQGTIVSLALQ